LKQNTAGLDLAARRGHTSLVSFSRSVVMRCLDELTAPRRYEGLNRRGRRQYAQASGRLLWLGFEMHYLAHLVVCRIGRIQPDHSGGLGIGDARRSANHCHPLKAMGYATGARKPAAGNKRLRRKVGRSAGR
jgi:hypothetical protein